MDDIRVRLRQFIAKTFSDEELDVFCFDHFPEVYDNFPREQTLVQKVLRLLTYCLKRDQIAQLMDALKRARPQQFSAEFIESVTSPQVADKSNDDSDVGYLDAQDVITEKMSHSKAALVRIMAHVQSIGNAFSEGTAALDDSANGKSQAKRIVNQIASRLYQFADQIEVETGLFATNFTESILNLKQLIAIALEMPNREQQVTEIRTLVPVLETLLSQMENGRSGLMQFRSSMGNLPRMTTEFTRSRNRAAKAVDDLLAEFDTAREAVIGSLNYAQSVS